MKVTSKGQISLSAIFPHKDVSVVKQCAVDINNKGHVVIQMYDDNGAKIEELPTKKKLSCTKNLVVLVRQETQRCWNSALKSLHRKYPGRTDAVIKSSYREELDSKYRELVCKLPTDVLESILLCHNKGRFRRAKITLQAISDEITRRMLLNDSSRIK